MESYDGDIRLVWVGSVVVLSSFLGGLGLLSSAIMVLCVLAEDGHDGGSHQSQNLLSVSFWGFAYFAPLFPCQSVAVSVSLLAPSVFFSSWSITHELGLPWITILAKRHPLGMENTNARKGYELKWKDGWRR